MMRFRSSTSGGTIEKSAARRAECSTCVTLGTGRPSTRYRCRSGSNVKSTPTLLALHETAEHVVLAAVVSQYCDAGHRLMPLPAGTCLLDQRIHPLRQNGRPHTACPPRPVCSL